MDENIRKTIRRIIKQIIMCLYPKLIKNRKYTINKKNGGFIPPVTDPRTLYVPIACGKCIECMKRKARDWNVRLQEEIKPNRNGKFITLTFSNESIQELCKHEKLKNLKGYELDNQLATLATRLFLERWRKKFKKSLRHWLVTELGHNGTENIHLHGIVWTNETYATIGKIWNYGFIWPRPETTVQTYVNSKTINYITKYVHKIDEKHKLYKPVILTSPGMGANYIKGHNATTNKYTPQKTNETYRTPSGHKIALPIYWRNKLYTDKEKESLWLEKLEKNIRYVCGEKVQADDTEAYYNLLKHYREINKQLGYGDDTKNWELEQYEKARRELNQWARLNPNGYPSEWDE